MLRALLAGRSIRDRRTLVGGLGLGTPATLPSFTPAWSGLTVGARSSTRAIGSRHVRASVDAPVRALADGQCDTSALSASRSLSMNDPGMGRFARADVWAVLARFGVPAARRAVG